MVVVNERDRKRTESSDEGVTTGLKVAIGCAIAAGVFVVLIIAAIVIAALNADKLVAFGLEKTATAILDQSSLSDAEKADGKQTTRRFIDNVQAGKIPASKVEAVLAKFTEGSVGQFLMIGVAHNALTTSDLPEAEKDAGIRNLQTFTAGMAQQKMSEAEVKSVVDAIPRQSNDEPKQPPWTEAELRNLLTQVDNAIMGKEIAPGGSIPITDDDLRQMIRAMKETMGEPVRNEDTMTNEE